MALIPKIVNRNAVSAVDFNGVPKSYLPGIDPYALDNLCGNLPYPLAHHQIQSLTSDDYIILLMNNASLYFPDLAGFAGNSGLVGAITSDAAKSLAYIDTGVIFPDPERYGFIAIPYDFESAGVNDPLFPNTLQFDFADPTDTSVTPIGPLTGIFESGPGCVVSAENNVAPGYYFFDIQTQTWFQAFEAFDGNLNASYAQHIRGGNGKNYTILSRFDMGAVLVEWEPVAYDGGLTFNSTSYALELDDPADDAIFQTALTDNNAATNWAGGYWQFMLDKIYFNAAAPGLSDYLVMKTVFAFEPDFSSYERIDVTPDAEFEGGMFSRGFDGTNYAFGFNAVDGIIQGFSSISISGTVKLGGVFNLGCWSPCANLAFRAIGEDL